MGKEVRSTQLKKKLYKKIKNNRKRQQEQDEREYKSVRSRAIEESRRDRKKEGTN